MSDPSNPRQHRWYLIALAPLVPLALACGGLGVSVDPQAHLEPLCELSQVVGPFTELAQAEVPVRELEPSVLVAVTADGMTVDWRMMGTPDQIREGLDEALAAGKAVAERTGAAWEPGITLLIGPEVPASQALLALRLGHEAGVEAFDLVVWSTQPLVTPPYPDPNYGAELEARLAEVAPDHRASIAAMELEGLVRLCPGAMNTLQAVGMASPDMRCQLMAAGLAEALPSCVATNGDRVLTATQVLLQPSSPWSPTAIRVTVDPEASALTVEDGATWAQLAPIIAAHHDGAVGLPRSR